MPTLRDVLHVAPGELVAFVGAGGKTTTLQRLLVELRAAGRTVLTTSTVHMFPLKGVAPHPFLVEPDPARLPAVVPGLLAANGHVRVAGAQLRADKIRGLAPEQITLLRGLPGVDHVLVEADGARHRSLKAPADHEPVLPSGVDILLIVAGLDIVGRPLTEEHVHRAEQVAALTGLAPGAPLTADAVARVLAHPAGGLKDAPPGARCWVVATKWSPETAAAGHALAAAVLAAGAPRIAGVILLGAGPVDAVGSAPLIVVQ